MGAWDPKDSDLLNRVCTSFPTGYPYELPGKIRTRGQAWSSPPPCCRCSRPSLRPPPAFFFFSFFSFSSILFFLYYHEFRRRQFRLRSRAAYDFNEQPIDRIKDTASRPYILNDRTVPRHSATDQGLARQTSGSVKYLRNYEQIKK